MLKSNGNILVIHDDEIRLAELRARLVPYFNIFVATDSRSAYRLLREFDMHVVLCAEKLRDMTGLQLTESVSGSFPDLVTVIQAGTSDYQILKEAVQAERIQHYLRFDADLDEIVQLLSSSLQLVQLRQENRSLSSQLKTKTDEQTRVLELFKRYVPEQVVSQTLLNGRSGMLKGETRVVSVLFADIRNFTRLAGSMRPSEVVSFLNDFWSAMSEPVRLNRGSVNKLIGDGMLALFGAPVSYMDNQENAVLCALDMIKALDKVNAKYEQQFGDAIKMGIGINTGEVVVGNVGSEDYMEYTVIGDAVNIAHRIEKMTKSEPNSILISSDTFDQVRYLIDADDFGTLVMDGKHQEIAVYRVNGRLDANIRPMQRGGLGY
jgi:adenylate cyclase